MPAKRQCNDNDTIIKSYRISLPRNITNAIYNIYYDAFAICYFVQKIAYTSRHY